MRTDHWTESEQEQVEQREESHETRNEKSAVSHIIVFHSPLFSRANCVGANRSSPARLSSSHLLAEASGQVDGRGDGTRRRGYRRTHRWPKGRGDWDRSGRRQRGRLHVRYPQATSPALSPLLKIGPSVVEVVDEHVSPPADGVRVPTLVGL